MAKVAIHVVTYNGMKYLPELFTSLANQTFRDVSVRIMDNGSSDGTREWLAMFVKQFFPRLQIFFLEENIGFVNAHNKLFLLAQEEYVQLINQDTILESNYIDSLVKHMDAHQKCGACAGFIYRFDGVHASAGTIDSAGLHVFPSRKCIDMRAGEYGKKNDLQQCAVFTEVFGVSGCLPMYRVSALKQVGEQGELFDPLFWMYKEDVELAYRLREYEWISHIIPHAIAYHDRTVGVDAKRSKRSFSARYHSYRNHLYILLKHESAQSLFLSFFSIIGYEMLKFMYIAIREPRILSAWKDIVLHTRHLRAYARAHKKNQKKHASSWGIKSITSAKKFV